MPGGESARVAARVREILRDESADDGEPVGRPALWQRLAARVPVRLDPGRRGALAVGAGVVLAALITGLWLLASRPRAMSVAPTPRDPSRIPGAVAPVGTAAAARVAASPSPSPSALAEVVVDVAGKVRRPGLYRLRPGTRVDDAVRAAGGALPGVSVNNLNLAARLSDGEQILVGLPGPGVGPAAGGGAVSGGGGGGGPGVGPGSSGPVNLNTATLDQLDALPGVGPVLAQHILDWRSEHGGFTAVSQLQDVSGIGPSKYDSLHTLVTV